MSNGTGSNQTVNSITDSLAFCFGAPIDIGGKFIRFLEHRQKNQSVEQGFYGSVFLI